MTTFAGIMKMKHIPAHIFVALIFTLSFRIVLQAQPNLPDDGWVFTDTSLPRVDISIHPDTLEWIYNNVESNIEWHATFCFTRDGIADTVEDIGFRLRGNTSRQAAKKSFKISFNTFQPGRKWHGLEKLNLNGEHNDPTIMRSKVAWHILRKAGIPAPRANHVLVYINGNFYGVYINVEHIDENFALSRFSDDSGNLFKCLYPADLDYKGDNPDLYKEEIYGRRAYDLKTNKGVDDYSDLAHLIDLVNNTPDQDLECRLNDYFNLADYLKIMAIDVLIGNWDGYIYNKNNYYLYHNPLSGRFEYIPYDLDNTLGIDWLGRDWASRDIYDWQQHGDQVRPLYTRMINNQTLKDIYSRYLYQLIIETLNPDTLFPLIDNWREIIAPWVEVDPYYPLDYGYTIEDFYNSYDQALGGHVDYGLKEYVQVRIESAMEQLELNLAPPVVNHIATSGLAPSATWVITAVIEPVTVNSLERVSYLIDGEQYYSFLYDDGEHMDGEEGDRIFGAWMPPLDFGQTLSWQIEVESEEGMTLITPCIPDTIQFIPSEFPPLRINEFMADNESAVQDEAGEYDDWIEIYNAGEETIWMGDKYLSDNPEIVGKWRFPDITLPAGAFLLVWADNDPGQGELHANFKLNKDGETIILSDNMMTGFQTLDSISFGPQKADTSYGRYPDGEESWMLFPNPTPGSTNTLQSISIITAPGTSSPVPNPADGFTRLAETDPVAVYNLKGDLIFRSSGGVINTSQLPNGLYFIRTRSGKIYKLVVLHH
ncbi:MAG: hypothetical protein Kow00127_02520 [Bacteroidales bacterium]